MLFDAAQPPEAAPPPALPPEAAVVGGAAAAPALPPANPKGKGNGARRGGEEMDRHRTSQSGTNGRS